MNTETVERAMQTLEAAQELGKHSQLDAPTLRMIDDAGSVIRMNLSGESGGPRDGYGLEKLGNALSCLHRLGSNAACTKHGGRGQVADIVFKSLFLVRHQLRSLGKLDPYG